MKLKILLISIMAFSLFSCLSKYEDEDVQRSRIADRLQHILEGFNRLDSDMIMTNYHPDFYHYGTDIYTQQFIWLERTITYSSMEIKILSIEILEDYAVARFMVSYKDHANEYGPYLEPEFNGDFSYFYYDKGEWLVYGNQKRY